jgi:hypothetical protein
VEVFSSVSVGATLVVLDDMIAGNTSASWLKTWNKFPPDGLPVEDCTRNCDPVVNAAWKSNVAVSAVASDTIDTAAVGAARLDHEGDPPESSSVHVTNPDASAVSAPPLVFPEQSSSEKI